MKITYDADALVADCTILGYRFRAGETLDLREDLAAAILRNPNFTDQNGRNAYSPPLEPEPAHEPEPAPASAPAKPNAKSSAPPAAVVDKSAQADAVQK
jgi:hypothetical protein